MKIIEQFKLSDDIIFELLVPPLGEKDNYFYEPTESLNKFDICTVILNMNGTKTTIIIEAIQDIICRLRKHLKKTFQNKSPLPSKIPIASLMNIFNRDDYRHYCQDDDAPYTDTLNYHSFWLWSMPPGGMQSWMYNRDHKIYLEINSPL